MIEFNLVIPAVTSMTTTLPVYPLSQLPVQQHQQHQQQHQQHRQGVPVSPYFNFTVSNVGINLSNSIAASNRPRPRRGAVFIRWLPHLWGFNFWLVLTVLISLNFIQGPNQFQFQVSRAFILDNRRWRGENFQLPKERNFYCTFWFEMNRNDAAGCFFRIATSRPGAAVSNPEIHLQTGAQEARWKTRPQRLSGRTRPLHSAWTCIRWRISRRWPVQRQSAKCNRLMNPSKFDSDGRSNLKMLRSTTLFFFFFFFFFFWLWTKWPVKNQRRLSTSLMSSLDHLAACWYFECFWMIWRFEWLVLSC